MSNRIQIGLYLALVTAACAVLNVLIIQGGGMANAATHKWIYAIMWAPGVAAILTALIGRRSLKGLGWSPWPPGQLLIGWAPRSPMRSSPSWERPCWAREPLTSPAGATPRR